MNLTNTMGVPVFEDLMFQGWSDKPTQEEIAEGLRLILDHLDKKIIRTNATKHGDIQLILKDINDFS